MSETLETVFHNKSVEEKSVKTVTIVFQPEGRRAEIAHDGTIMEAALKVGINIVAPCGGTGECGKCKVEVFKGHIRETQADKIWLTKQELEKGFRLACTAKVDKNIVVRIPFATRLFSQKILTSGKGEPVEPDPDVYKFFVKIKPPSVDDPRGDFERLLDTLAFGRSDFAIDLDLLPRLSMKLRNADYSGTVTFVGYTLMDFQPEDTTDRQFAVALDVGTSTLVGTLIDLKAGEQVEIASRMNPQMSFGDDLISRIDYAATHKLGTLELQRRLADTLNELILELVQKKKISPEDIYEVVMVGNTVMHHIFLKLTPEFLGQSPFAPTIQSAVRMPAKDLGLNIHPKGQVYAFPNIAGFVGGDAVGVILSSGIFERKGAFLAVDIGTNGEILLSVDGKLLTASAAAGPAFEGARIFQGMRGTTGAIERVQIENGHVLLEVIDNVSPCGICGSGLIDAVAELRRAGIINESGRVVDLSAAGSKRFPELASRIIDHSHGKAFVLAAEEASGIEGPVLLTQKDVRELQLAKAAIATAIKILLKEGNVRAEALDEILLAGGFGNYMDRVSAIRIGLIPAVPVEKVRFIGNAASAGAQMAVVSRAARQKAESIARKARHIELSVRPDFQEEFMEAIFFPETETIDV